MLGFVGVLLLFCCCELFFWVGCRFLILFRWFLNVVFNGFLFLGGFLLLFMLLKLLEFFEVIFIFCIWMVVLVFLEFVVFVFLDCFFFCFWIGGDWWGVMFFGFDCCWIFGWIFNFFVVEDIWWCFWVLVVCFWWLGECVFCVFCIWVLWVMELLFIIFLFLCGCWVDGLGCLVLEFLVMIFKFLWWVDGFGCVLVRGLLVCVSVVLLRGLLFKLIWSLILVLSMVWKVEEMVFYDCFVLYLLCGWLNFNDIIVNDLFGVLEWKSGLKLYVIIIKF